MRRLICPPLPTPVRSVSVVTFGETMALMRSTDCGPLSSGTTFSLGVGGAESNVAIGLARLGVSVAWRGRVGADAPGEVVRTALAGEGVEACCIVDEDAPTGLMLKHRRIPGRSAVSYYRRGSAGSRLSPADLDADQIRRARVLHVSGITPALSESARETTMHALDIAQAAGVAVSFDVNYRSRLWSPEVARATFREIASRADFVFAGLEEAELLVDRAGADDEPEDLAARVRDLGPREAVIKLGPSGALSTGVVTATAPAFRVDVVDSVGAGDAFVAGWIAALLDGAPARDRLVLGNQTGAFACMSEGDWEGAASLDDLDLLLEAEPVRR
jgi:2-dehydro-3-deoxygluconokinase